MNICTEPGCGRTASPGHQRCDHHRPPPGTPTGPRRWVQLHRSLFLLGLEGVMRLQGGESPSLVVAWVAREQEM